MLDRASLAHTAMACRAFHDPAMNLLWYSLEDLRPLILLLPGGRIGISERDSLLVRASLASECPVVICVRSLEHHRRS